MVQLQVIELFVASSDLAVTSVVLRGTLCSIVFYFCCVARDIMQHCVVLLFCWEGHYAAMCCTSVVFARDIMQHCLVLLLCWEGHYAAFFCTSVVLGGILCSIILYFCCVGRDIMQQCVVLLLCLRGTLCSNVLYFCCVCEGHYAALSCTSVVLGGTLCSIILYFCCVGRDIMQPFFVLLALQIQITWSFPSPAVLRCYPKFRRNYDVSKRRDPPISWRSTVPQGAPFSSTV